MTANKPKKQRIINCVSQLPYKITLDESSDDWIINPATGNSALYSSLDYLQDSDEYEQIVVGWTGEISKKTLTKAELLKKQLEEEKLTSNNSKDNKNDSTANENNNGNNNSNNVHGNGLDEDKLYVTNEQMNNLKSKINKNYNPVWLLRSRKQSRWRNYAENIIWPLFHYILNPSTEVDLDSDGSDANNSWYDYVKFNEAYAMKIGEIYQPGDIIWIHDYYLLLLPQLLRMKFNSDSENNLVIGYFHHAPWPSYEYFRCLPRRKEILDGLVGADRISFQNEQFSRHFVSSCKRLLDSTSKKVKNDRGKDQYNMSVYGGDLIVDSSPIGVDTDKIMSEAFTPDVDSKVDAIRQAYQGKKIIIGRDRFDPVRGIIQKLRAFETFLAMYPEWREQVVLIQVSSPTLNRESPQNIRLEQQVNELVNSINSQYGNLNFAPVQHYYMRIPKDVYFSLLRAANLCLITSVRDGMNTTALEYVTIKSHDSNSSCYGMPLILSEFSGSSSVLKDAIIVNPWDSVAVAKSINNAFNLTKVQRETIQDKTWAEVPSIKSWTDTYMDQIVEVSKQSESQDRKKTPALNRPVLLENYKAANRRLFLFDYDGTLTPIVKDPAAAIPTARLYTIMEKLSQDPKNQIWIISGRDQVFLNKWWGSKNKHIGLSAEHGCFVKDIGTPEWVNLAKKFDMSWQVRVNKVMEDLTTKTPGSFIERKEVALTWHYRAAVPELGDYNATELKRLLLEFTEDFDLDVMEGKKNIEVRPKFVNKGEIVKRLVWHKYGTPQDLLKPLDQKLPIDEMPDFILCLGDDFTDEDMFRQLNSIESHWNGKYDDKRNRWGNFGFYPVTVGSAAKVTVAKAHLTDPQQVLDTLGLLVGNVSLFQSAGTVELDARGHVKDSESSKKSHAASVAYTLKRTGSSTSINKK
ncbi:similar to Saccharomyces cerevisiae YDR074W TPS2 Phosphatase subunit of the trehalose-6- phosphate synthase/phosphatase complex, which synthesizes the storage carbohydrate trehalose [Maudiozyma barnettii]|uniref:Similar to Saccharomyces cerevisiae YDR074W TPS2 Phosphatase subunit of the trehalose-6- phosphate synthase/phosphatase complex, which synthesizes the storage carbohydrate trehalose n=1 Tax=Maudiozyma barnettii TaxID=61262 RepID=A0A8H2VJ87_9SACH|nr:trehalose-phosphatase TPS2 [Kazachstania barnettii]CAB4256580.1 similar to Saccharomyces cerevisiae YDR074W TPS2 Phosphatase subunit of the trehalose-6- phosphate synthase/phosphatase complex, which synthesizes the storage carbohydrate trehalose [Kazachstania barnettii]CAD1785183.1 similar to Saccharomyces cerevisiae YDR074W TPS2 Phosphatase subunit of the trehalose-6- phosphate synthase/phosphatase complex, which synthesizes the storage carbohydrate trehalose [Kazachstania barnettii]